MCSTCPMLRERVERLEAELKVLRSDFHAESYVAPAEFALNWSQERILGALIRHTSPLTHDALFEVTRGPRARAEDRGEKLIHTVVCKLRQKLRPHGVEINTVSGVGYRLSTESRNRLLHWNEQQTQAA